MSLVFGSAVITNNISGGGISAATPVLVASTQAGTLASSFQNSSIIDGITLTTGDRILIKNQASGVENGVYTVNVSGAPTRAVDVPVGSGVAGKIFQIIAGTTNADTSWTVTNDPPNDIVGTNALILAQITKTGAASFISGPVSSTIDRVALWNNTSGTLLKQTTALSIDSSDNLVNVGTLKFSGANVLTIAGATQTTSNATATVPDLVGAGDTFAMLNKAQTLTNKTLTAPNISTIINSGTLTLPSSTDTLVARATVDTLTNKTLIGANISIDDTASAFNLGLISTSSPALTADRSITLDVNNANRVLDLNGNLTLGGSFTTSGSSALTLTTTGPTNVTLPTSGTLISGNGAGNAWDIPYVSGAGPLGFTDNLQWLDNSTTLQLGGTGSNVTNVWLDINGNVNNYTQMNIKNKSNGGSASQDVVATNNTGNDNSGYIDMGINSTGYNDPAFTSGGPGDGYLYCAGGALALMTDTAGKDVTMFAGGTLSTNEIMRVMSTGNVTIGKSAVATSASNGFLYITSCAGTPTGVPTSISGRIPLVVDSTNGLLYYNSGSWQPAVGLTQTQTITNKTLTSPRINGILDTNGLSSITLGAIGGAVNYLTINNAATLSNPTISATGTDTNINIDLITKGSGAISIKSAGASNSGELRLYEDSTSGTAYIGLKAPQANGSFTSSTTYTFPADYGANGQYLMSNGAGALSWGTPAGGGSVYSMTNATATYTTTSTSYTTITTMTITPASGTYYVMFNASGGISASTTQFNYGIAVAGTVDANTVRRSATAGNHSAAIIVNMSTIGICTVNGSQSIDVRVRRSSGTGTLSVYERSLYLFKLI